MAILIFPIGFVLGWFIRLPARAAAVTSIIGLGALAGLVVLELTGTAVSPFEGSVLILGTPVAAVLAFKVASWRLSRRTTPG